MFSDMCGQGLSSLFYKCAECICEKCSQVHLSQGVVPDEMCRGSKAILTLDRRSKTEMRSRTEQVMSTTEEAMITLVHQLERENWSTRAIQVYYLYIIAWESTTVSNSGLCT